MGQDEDSHGPLTGDELASLVQAVDAVISELHDDLVRRAIVHLTSVRQALVSAAERALAPSA